QERHTGVDGLAAGAIQIDGYPDAGLLGVAGNISSTHCQAFSSVDSRRYSALAACAGRPSPRASTEAMRPRVCAPSRETLMTLERFWKSYTPRGDENLALRAVGST